MYVVVVGYFVAGLPGAVAGVLSLASPALLAVPIAHLVLRGRSEELRGACTGIVIVSCALMVAAGLRLVPQATPTAAHLLIVIVGFSVVAVTKVKPVWVILVAACSGLVL